MKAAAPLKLREAGQSLWLDNITRDLLTSGTLKRYIDELSITGLTSNPTIFDHAITKSQAYDAAIRQKIGQDKSDEEIFFELALEDLTQAADLFRRVVDGPEEVGSLREILERQFEKELLIRLVTPYFLTDGRIIGLSAGN